MFYRTHHAMCVHDVTTDVWTGTGGGGISRNHAINVFAKVVY